MDKLFLVFLSFLLGALIFTTQTFPTYASPAYEDFTAYTEVDPNNHINYVGTDHVDFQGYRNEDCYLYYDYGVDFFGSDWEHLVDVRVAASNTLAISECWMLSNALDDMNGLFTAEEDLLTIFFYESSLGVINIYLREYYNAVHYSDSYVGVENTWYYFTIQKAGTAFTCKIYSDSARTSLLDTLSITLQADHSFRYVFACNSYNAGTAQINDLDIENLDLQITGDTTHPTYNLMGLNSTLNASGIQFTINLSDNVELDTCLLEWNNTESFINISYSLSGANYLLLANQTLHATEAVRIYYRFFFNDTSGNMNVTVQHFLITNTEPLIGPPPHGLSPAQLFVGALVILGSIMVVGYLASKK